MNLSGDARPLTEKLAYPNGLFTNAPDRGYLYRILPTGPKTSSLVTTMLIRPVAKAPRL